MASQASKFFLKSIGAPDYSDRLGGETFMSLVKAKGKGPARDVSGDKLRGSDHSEAETINVRGLPKGKADNRSQDWSVKDPETGEARYLGHPDNPHTKHLPYNLQSAALTGVLHQGGEMLTNSQWAKDGVTPPNQKSPPRGHQHPDSKYYPAYLYGRAAAMVSARVKSSTKREDGRPFASDNPELRAKQLSFGENIRPGTAENVGGPRQRWDPSFEDYAGSESATTIMQALRAEKHSHIDGPDGKKIANMHHTPAGDDEASQKAQARSRTAAETFLKGADKPLMEAAALNRITHHFLRNGGSAPYTQVVAQSPPLGDFNHRERPTPIPVHLDADEVPKDHPAATFPHLLKDAPQGYHDPRNAEHGTPHFSDYTEMLESRGVTDHGVGTANAALEHLAMGGIHHVQGHIGSAVKVATPTMMGVVGKAMLHLETNRSQGTKERFGTHQLPAGVKSAADKAKDFVSPEKMRRHSSSPEILVGPPREGGAKVFGQTQAPAKAPKPSAGKKTAAPKIGKVKTPKAAPTPSPAPKQSGAAPGLFDGMLGSDGKIA